MNLHLGCGKRNFGKDWIHIDRANYSHLDSHDITKLDYDDESVKLIYASHVIEYFDRDEIYDLLNEWYRVLKMDGILRLAVPDFYEMIKLYNGNNLESFLGPLYGKMIIGEEVIYHKTVYDFESITKVLHNARFTDVYKYDWEDTEHASFDDHSQAYIPHMNKENGTLISLNVEALK